MLDWDELILSTHCNRDNLFLNDGLRWIGVIYSTLQIYFKTILGLSKAIKMLIRHEKKKVLPVLWKQKESIT